MIFLFIILSVWAEAEKNIYIQAPAIEELEFLAQSQSDPKGQNLGHLLLDRTEDPKLKTQLREHFLLAQTQFLKNETTTTLPLWRKVTNFVHKSDWEPAQREMLQLAYLRLAQLHPHWRESEQLITEALRLDPDLNIATWNLPPEWLRQWDLQKKSMNWVHLPVTAFTGFSHILVNGRAFPILPGVELKIPDGVHRFTWISHQYWPVTRVMESKNVIHLELHREPIVSGTCQSPKILRLAELQQNFLLETKNVRISFPDQCVAQLPAAHNKNTFDFASPPPISAPFVNTENQKDRPFYKSRTFWWGAALITGSIVLLQTQNNNADATPKPTHRDGL